MISILKNNEILLQKLSENLLIEQDTAPLPFGQQKVLLSDEIRLK
jgi:hypothetical protein